MNTNSRNHKTQLTELAKAVGTILGVPLAATDGICHASRHNTSRVESRSWILSLVSFWRRPQDIVESSFSCEGHLLYKIWL